MARTSIIGPTSIVIGDISGRGDLEIVGRVQGDVVLEGSVIVAPEGVVLGSIRALEVRVAGRVDGTVAAKDSLSLQAGANVSGDLVAARLGIEEGARVRGSVRTEGSEPAEEEEPTHGEGHPRREEREAPIEDELLVLGDEPTSDAPSEAPPGQERRRRDRRRRRSHAGNGGGAPPPPLGPSAAGLPAPKKLSPSPAPAGSAPQRPQSSGRGGPPAPIVPALAKGVRGRRRPSQE